MTPAQAYSYFQYIVLLFRSRHMGKSQAIVSPLESQLVSFREIARADVSLFFFSFFSREISQLVSSPGFRPLSKYKSTGLRHSLFKISLDALSFRSYLLRKASKTSSSRQVRSRRLKLERLTCHQLSLYRWHG